MIMKFEHSPINFSDINECTIGTHNCHMNATCINTDGSFSCRCKETGVICKEGTGRIIIVLTKVTEDLEYLVLCFCISFLNCTFNCCLCPSIPTTEQ